MGISTGGLVYPLLAAVLAGSAACANAGNSAPPPSAFGPDDTIGAANYLSAKAVLEAAKLIKTGKTYALGMKVDAKASVRGHRTYSVTIVQPGPGDGVGAGTNRLTVNDDLVSAWQGIGTQLDGFGHAGIANLYYNQTPARDFVRHDGVTRFSTADVPPIVTRGVLLDIAGLKGVDHLEPGTPINRSDIEAACKRQDVRIRKGDVVILHTGWMDARLNYPATTGINGPGIGMEGARYLAGLGVVAVGADTFALEVWPSEDPAEMAPVHQELLARRGVYLLQNIVTRELARDKAWTFLFVLGQARYAGAVQAIINPIAIR